MSKFGRWTMAVVTALGLGAEAFGATLVTGALRIEPGEIVACTALNAANSVQEGLQVELLEAVPFGPVSLNRFQCLFKKPGDACDTAHQNDGVTRFMFCKVTAPDKRTVRGVIQNVATGATLEAR